MNKRITDAVIWYEQTLQKQLSNRSSSFERQSSYQPYTENAYNSGPYSDHGFALPPTPVQPSYGEFYSNRINELSHESHPQIYSAPPLESPSGGHAEVGVPSYPPEGFAIPPQNPQDSYSQRYTGQEYAPEAGYAPYPSHQSYPPHYGGVYQGPQGDAASHNGQAQQQTVEEEKPLIEF